MTLSRPYQWPPFLLAPLLVSQPIGVARSADPVARVAASHPGCPRPTAGSTVAEPPSLYSRAGELNVSLNYLTSRDEAGRQLFCFMTPDGLESPTLHVRPGDRLNILLANRIPPANAGPTGRMTMAPGGVRCGAMSMDATSVNIHFHGANVSPTCHSDEVIHTLVNAGETFEYHVAFPKAQPPGLYWYHPHVHGQTDQAVKGGASGAIVVDGIERFQPIVARLPQRTLIVRDQTVSGRPQPGGDVPTSDVTLNYVPIAYPAQVPAVIAIKPGRREFWRVLNASAETVVDISLAYDGVEQPLKVVGLDGVPTGSRNGKTAGDVLTMSHIAIPAAGRAEFVITGPARNVRRAMLVSHAAAMGPDGDHDPARTLARLEIDPSDAAGAARAPRERAPLAAKPPVGSMDDLNDAAVTARRTLYFSETPIDPYDPDSRPKYYITLAGATPRLFDPADPPAIVTRQGSVEEWTIENHSREMHEFHIHQIHFKLVKRDGEPLPRDEQQYVDTAQIPFWSGTGPYPSLSVLIDFRGDVTGDLLYHCHLLDHEDGGMMAIVRVLPRTTALPPRR